VRHAGYWLLQSYSQQLDIEPMVQRFQPGVREALGALSTLAGGRSGQRLARDTQQLASVGLPPPLAAQIASLSLMTQTLDIVELAREFGLEVREVGRLYFAVAEALRLDVLHEHVDALKVEGRWRAMARTTLRASLAQEHRALLRSALAACRGRGAAEALEAWLARHHAEIARVQRALDDMLASGPMDFATLSVALKEIGRLA
jgi:glutamate dehydrogenase